MAVTEVKLSSVGTSGTASGTDSSGAVRTYQAIHRVKCNDVNDTAPVILNHFKATSTLPWLGRRFNLGNGFDAFRICNNVQVSYVESSEGWHNVTSSYVDIAIGDLPAGGQGSDPLKWPDDIEVSFTQYTVPVEEADFRGFEGVANPFMQFGRTLPVTNSAKIPLDPPMEIERDIKIIRITRSIKSYDDTMIDRFNGAVNNDWVTIRKPDYNFVTRIEPFCGRIKFLGGTFGIQNNIKYWRHSIEIHVNPDTWRRWVLDLGTDELYRSGDTLPSGKLVNATTAPSGYLYQKILGEDDAPITAPLPFNGQGKRNAPGAPAVYGAWRVYREMSFAGIRW